MSPIGLKVGMAAIIGWFLRDALDLMIAFYKGSHTGGWKTRTGNLFETVVVPCALCLIGLYLINFTFHFLSWLDHSHP